MSEKTSATVEPDISGDVLCSHAGQPAEAVGGDCAYRVLQSLRRIMRAVSVYSRRINIENRVTTPQLICLHALRRCESLTSGQLAREVNVSLSTATGILDRLEEKGLVRRERSGSDRRKVYVALTSTGEAVVETSPSLLQDRLAAGLAHLPTPEQAGIAEALEKIVGLMDAEALDAAPHLVNEPTFATLEENHA